MLKGHLCNILGGSYFIVSQMEESVAPWLKYNPKSRTNKQILTYIFDHLLLRSLRVLG